MADTPTQHAQINFNDAYRDFMPLYMDNESGDMHALGMGLSQLANGLNQLSKALRATYMKLEEIERKLNIPR
jgi:hypothetical protein